MVLAVAGVSLGLVLLWLGRATGRLLRRRRNAHAPWELAEHSDGDTVVVYAERPGEDKLLIGAASFDANDFDSQLWELRSKGRNQVYVLNEGNNGR